MSHDISVTRALRSLTALPVLLGASALLHAQEPLSLDEALRLAAERSQALVAQDAAASAARHMAVAASQAPDPVLRAGIDNLPVNGPDEFSLTRDFMTMRSIGLMRELTRSDQRAARAARFEREAQAAEADRLLALADLERETALAWLERYYGERMRDVLLAQRDEAALQVEAADLAYRSGIGAQSDVFATRSSVAQIEDRIAAAERDVEVANVRLARWVGGAASRSLAAPPEIGAVSLAAADLEAEVIHHPMIAALAKQEEIARADAEIARANKRPSWSIEVMYSLRGSAFSDMVSLNVSRPLQWRQRNRQDRELAAKLAVAEQMLAEREEETRAHLADAQALMRAWQGNRERLERYASTLVPLAAEGTAAATTAYRSGRGTLDAVLAARLNEIEVRLDDLGLELETASFWAQLEYLIPAGHDAAAHE